MRNFFITNDLIFQLRAETTPYSAETIKPTCCGQTRRYIYTFKFWNNIVWGRSSSSSEVPAVQFVH